MKKLLNILMGCLLLFACDKASENGAKGATGVILSTDKVDLIVGETVAVTATVLPESLGMDVVWSILDEEYAEVKDGVITGKAEGVTYAVATSADGTRWAACMVSVNPDIPYVISVKDGLGTVLSGIYGYPGMSLTLSAETSDGMDHSFSWSVEDPSVGSITADGCLTLAASPSADRGHVYDGQTHLKIETEEGYGCRIPVRSSLIKGINVGDDFYGEGMDVAVQVSGRYPISVLYEGMAGPLPVPADDVDLRLSDEEGFSLENANGTYVLVTGQQTGVSSLLSVAVAGSTEMTEIASFMVDKVYDITASCTNKSSSTLVFTWSGSVPGGDAFYIMTLYKDKECLVPDQSFEIPVSCGAWAGNQPKYVFAGLKPSADYWFRVVSSDGLESNLVKVATEAFSSVSMPSAITGAGVVLAEDFGEVRWDYDRVAGAVGFFPSDNSDFDNIEVDVHADNDANGVYGGYHASGKGGEIEVLTLNDAVSNSRLDSWLFNGPVYVHPGYLRLSNSSTKGWMITPEFTVPVGKKAVVKVTVTAGRHDNKENSEYCVAVLTAGQVGADKENHTAEISWPSASDSKVIQKLSFTNDNTWEAKSAEGLEIRSTDRLILGPPATATGKNRLQVSDITVTVTEYVDE